MIRALPAVFAAIFLSTLAAADDAVFSGPQVGEPLVPFEAQAAFGRGEKVQALADDRDAPTLLVFVHQVTRPSVGLARLLMDYAATKKDEGLHAQLVFLSDDPTETQAFLRRARQALPQGVVPLISTDGIEGPGTYGLNRKMTLTVLVGEKGQVTANFPLVQPSVQTDAPQIGHAIVKVLGGDEAPTLAEMGYEEPRMAMRRGEQDPARDGMFRQMMSPVIQQNATPAEVAAAAKNVEDFAAEHPWFQQRLHEVASRIVNSGRLANYGTPEAQEHLQKWASDDAAADENAADESPAKESELEESGSAESAESP